ncbi:MAG: ferritin family protein [Thermoguttaceae bacterium]|jgi:rubrerythrin
MKRGFLELSPAEVLALAISLEEEDARILQEFARLLRPNYPKAAADLDAMRQEEDGHRHRLVETFRRRYGEEIPLVSRQDIKGFVRRDPLQSAQPWDVARIRRYVALMELETQRFYSRAAAAASDAETRQLLGDLAEAERAHEVRSAQLAPDRQPLDEHQQEALVARQLFVMQVIQPGLVGLMDGSVSTLAPLFAAAFATRAAVALGSLSEKQATWSTFLVGLAAAVGAGISMGFAEALSDDGSLTGRGRPLLRGVVCALMTFAGGIFHALPYLIPHFWAATAVASTVVAVELLAIAWIRNRYMDSPFFSTAFQVIVGGTLVFLAGVLIGSS